MSNYTNQNLITTTAVTGSRAIKIGNKIFVGLYEPMKFYKCVSVNSSDNTWTGYLWNEKNNSFSNTITSNLKCDTITPIVNGIYSQDLTIKIQRLGLNDNNTQLLLIGNLSDISQNNINVTNNGLTFDNKKIVCSQSNYAYITENTLPTNVFSSDQQWTLQLKFKCTNTNYMSSSYMCIFGNGNANNSSNRLDIIINYDTIQIGGMGNNINWQCDANWHTYKITHDSNNYLNTYLDNVFYNQVSFYGNPREERLYLSYDGQGRYGYPFEISYIQISDCIR